MGELSCCLRDPAGERALPQERRWRLSLPACPLTLAKPNQKPADMYFIPKTSFQEGKGKYVKGNEIIEE